MNLTNKRWNQGNLDQNPFEPLYKRAAHQVRIEVPVARLFESICLEVQPAWLPAESAQLLCSESGKNETGCVFLEPSSGLSMLRAPGANTYWYVTRYDTEQHRFDVVWLTRDLTIARREFGMTDLGSGQTRVNWSLIYTGLGQQGNRIIAEPGLDRRMKRGLRFLATYLKHYVETGSIYRLSGGRKVRIAAAMIGACLGRRLRSLHAGTAGSDEP